MPITKFLGGNRGLRKKFERSSRLPPILDRPLASIASLIVDLCEGGEGEGFSIAVSPCLIFVKSISNLCVLRSYYILTGFRSLSILPLDLI